MNTIYSSTLKTVLLLLLCTGFTIADETTGSSFDTDINALHSRFSDDSGTRIVNRDSLREKKKNDPNHLLRLIAKNVREKRGKTDTAYTYEWKIRGKSYPDQSKKIFIEQIPGRIDTVFHRHPGDTVWRFFLTRFSFPGQYESRVNPCCGDFFLRSTGKIPTIDADVIFRMVNTDGKLYLARIAGKGAILRDSVRIKNPCRYNWSAMYTNYTMISIEEIDTVDCPKECWHIELCDGVDPVYYPEGAVIDPNEVTDCCLPRGLMCFEENGKKVQGGIGAYCSRRRVAGFRFYWLDDKPLIVEFDAETKEVSFR